MHWKNEFDYSDPRNLIDPAARISLAQQIDAIAEPAPTEPTPKAPAAAQPDAPCIRCGALVGTAEGYADGKVATINGRDKVLHLAWSLCSTCAESYASGALGAQNLYSLLFEVGLRCAGVGGNIVQKRLDHAVAEKEKLAFDIRALFGALATRNREYRNLAWASLAGCAAALVVGWCLSWWFYQ